MEVLKEVPQTVYVDKVVYVDKIVEVPREVQVCLTSMYHGYDMHNSNILMFVILHTLVTIYFIRDV